MRIAMMGSGGLVVLDETDCMVNVAKYFLEFTKSESCGKCIPCRVGTKRLLEILTRITEGKGREGDIDLLETLSSDVKTSSLCGLGQSAPNPVLSTIRYYRDEYEAHIRDKRCPAGVCKDLLTYSIIAEACKGCNLCVQVCPDAALVTVRQTDENVERLRRMGTDVTLFEYPGAYHAFDSTTAPASSYWAEAITPRNCAFIERDGRIVDPATGKVAGIDAPCMTRGAHFGHNPDAYRKAVDDVRGFLRAAFKMP